MLVGGMRQDPLRGGPPDHAAVPLCLDVINAWECRYFNLTLVCTD